MYWTYGDMKDLIDQIGIDAFLSDIRVQYPDLYQTLVKAIMKNANSV